MRIIGISVLTILAAVSLCSIAMAGDSQTGNLGYNSYEGYLSEGTGLNKWFGPGGGYPAQSGDYFHRYIPPEEWGRFGYGTGHMGEGYGPYIFPKVGSPSPPGMFDPLPGAYQSAPPPKIRVKHGVIQVGMPSNIPGITCVTVTILAFNGAELATQCIGQPPYNFQFPVLDGSKNVRVRIDYINNGLSATSYPL